jgi:Zn-dependent protease with chaperone function
VGSVAGFVLVFVVCAWALSALGGIALSASGDRLHASGPLVERRVAATIAIVPLVLATAVVITLVLQSTLGVDHCPVHGHHAHLCLAHDSRWLELPSVVAMLAIAGATLVGRATLVAIALVRGARSIRALHAISRTVGSVRIVDSERPFCFVAGREPAIYVSSRVWDALPPAEREALVAHESAHVEHGDLQMRVVMEICLVFAAPLVGDRVRDLWICASERLCDARAARATSPENVASAMVSLCRLQTTRPAASFGFTPGAAELAGRVEAVLEQRPLGERVATIAGRIVFLVCAVFVAGAAIAAEPLHHAFETLLG